MHFETLSTYEKLSERAADFVAAQILLNPRSVLGLPTGDTPLGTYRQLAARHKAGKLDFSQITTFNLDEYLGLAPNHPQSYRYFMETNLFSKVNLPAQSTHVPGGIGEGDEMAAQYDRLLQAAGGITLQLLGIGHNGHIGFNEPGAIFTAPTHAVTLTPETIAANARFFQTENEVPRRAVTMGMRPILQAKKIVLIAAGEDKLNILQRALTGPITPEVPASLLQLHPDCTTLYTPEKPV